MPVVLEENLSVGICVTKQCLGVVVGFVWPDNMEPNAYGEVRDPLGAVYRLTTIMPNHVLVKFRTNVDRSQLTNADWAGIDEHEDDGHIVPVPCGSFVSTVKLTNPIQQVSVTLTTVPLVPAFALSVSRVQGATLDYVDVLNLAGVKHQFAIGKSVKNN